MNFIDRLFTRLVNHYQAMDFIVWFFLHWVLVIIAIMVISKLVSLAHARLTRQKRRVLRPMPRKRN